MISGHEEGADLKIASMIKTRTQFWAREMGLWLRVYIPLLEERPEFGSQHPHWVLTTACNSYSRGPNILLKPPQASMPICA